ncbi:MAG: acetoacetate decarboxylase family protein [Chloroflexota bacterium]
MSEQRRPSPIRPGSGIPYTASGRSIGYRPPPWGMRGRTLAVWYRLADPDEARRHLPPGVEIDPDPLVRVRFWDLEHDAAGPALDEDRTEVWTPIREAVVAFPVRYGGISADLPAYMYADDPIYIAMGRELMGWPVRGAVIELDPEPAGGPHAGMQVHARMLRGDIAVMEATLTVEGSPTRDVLPPPPRWLAEKVIGRVDGPGVAISQLVSTGPERIDHRDVWPASATLTFREAPRDELTVLAPREIVKAEYWADVAISVGWGEVLAELGDTVHDRG